jgi:hypothetical protein
MARHARRLVGDDARGWVDEKVIFDYGRGTCVAEERKCGNVKSPLQILAGRFSAAG